MTKARRKCAFPGCEARLHPRFVGYIHGVCKDHRHAAGLCQCEACSGQRTRAKISDSADVRVAEVPYATGNSGIGGTVKVTLPREPWLRGTA